MPCEKIKFYRVAPFGLSSVVPDTVSHVLVAGDGDAYLVCRLATLPTWVHRSIVMVTMRRALLPCHGCEGWMPLWHRHGVVEAHRYELLRPADIVAKLYSDRVGCQLLPHRCPDDPYDEEYRLGIDVPFEPSHFVDCDSSMTAAVKSLTANSFARFALNGFRRSDFDPLIYIALGQSFGMGPMTKSFHRRWFGTPTQQLTTCRKIAEYPVAGDSAQSLCDLERAIQYVVIRYVLRAAASRSASARSMLERRLLIRLLRRHGMPSHLKPLHRTAE